MRVEFGLGLVNVADEAARQFELAARFQRDGAAALALEQADQIAGIGNRLPVGLTHQPGQQGLHAAIACIGDGAVIGTIERDLLVLRADAPLRLRLLAICDPGDEFVAGFDRRRIGYVTGHAQLFLSALS